MLVNVMMIVIMNDDDCDDVVMATMFWSTQVFLTIRNPFGPIWTLLDRFKQELIFCSEAPLPTPTLSIWGKKIIFV